jgi:hypothetical protein
MQGSAHPAERSREIVHTHMMKEYDVATTDQKNQPRIDIDDLLYPTANTQLQAPRRWAMAEPIPVATLPSGRTISGVTRTRYEEMTSYWTEGQPTESFSDRLDSLESELRQSLSHIGQLRSSLGRLLRLAR